jgi:hypothetical protein
VDGTNFWLAMGYSKPFWSYKFQKIGARYEEGLCIKTGGIFAGEMGRMSPGFGTIE